MKVFPSCKCCNSDPLFYCSCLYHHVVTAFLLAATRVVYPCCELHQKSYYIIVEHVFCPRKSSSRKRWAVWMLKQVWGGLCAVQAVWGGIPRYRPLVVMANCSDVTVDQWAQRVVLPAHPTPPSLENASGSWTQSVQMFFDIFGQTQTTCNIYIFLKNSLAERLFQRRFRMKKMKKKTPAAALG